MIERGDGLTFLLEPRRMRALKLLDSYHPMEPCIARFPHFAHAACAQRRENFVRAEFVAGRKRHVRD